jgi:transposase
MEFGLQAVPALVGVGPLGCDARGAQRQRGGSEQRADGRFHYYPNSSARLWCKKGARNQDIGRSRGGQTTKIHLRTNSIGLPIAVTLSSGEASDYKGYEPLMQEPGPEPKVLIADKGYDSDAIRDGLAERHVEAIIPFRRNRKVQLPIDGYIYALRNLIERCFAKLKHSRRLATRYDKTSESYIGFVLIASVRLWCRYFVNTP